MGRETEARRVCWNSDFGTVDTLTDDVRVDAVQRDFLLGEVVSVRSYQASHTAGFINTAPARGTECGDSLFRRCVDWQGGNAVEATDARDTADWLWSTPDLMST